MTEQPLGEIPGLSPEQIATLRAGGAVTVDPRTFRPGSPDCVEHVVDHSPRETR